MDHKKIQKSVNDLFTEAFVRTPLVKRLEDISGECRELTNYSDLKNLREETGDLLASLIQLANECNWDISELLQENNEKIKRRMDQYKGRGRKTHVALLGGAFDCIHNAHIKLAEFVLNASMWADEVWFCPSYQHMDGKKMADSKHRTEMIRLAICNDGRMKLFSYEITHKLHGETYHFLTKLINDKEYENYRFKFIIGMDRANTIATWYNSEELLKMDVGFIVVDRDGVKRDTKVDWYLHEPHLYLNDEKGLIPDFSSTRVKRELNLPFGDADSMVPEPVFLYIKENDLYV